MTKTERSYYVRGVLDTCIEMRVDREAVVQVCRDLAITVEELEALANPAKEEPAK